MSKYTQEEFLKRFTEENDPDTFKGWDNKHRGVRVRSVWDWFKKALEDATSPERVTRVEVIDENGRSYVNWDENNKVELSYQDEGRTLKIFISKREVSKL